MRKLVVSLTIFFLILLGFYFFVMKPEKYEDIDIYEDIMKRGVIRVGINTEVPPFGFIDSEGKIQGYDADLARYISQYLLNNPNSVQFVPVTPENRIIKVSTGEADILIATTTITQSRKQIIDFSIPYDSAGQALLVKADSKITSISDLSGQNVGVIWGTTAEKNMLNLVPSANIMGFKTYNDAYRALKEGRINAITSDDTILSGFAIADKNVKLLPKKYSREPYGIGFKKGKCSARLKENIDFAISDMKQKNVITRLHNKWLR